MYRGLPDIISKAAILTLSRLASALDVSVAKLMQKAGL